MLCTELLYTARMRRAVRRATRRDDMDTAAFLAVIAFIATCGAIAYTIAFIVDRIVNR